MAVILLIQHFWIPGGYAANIREISRMYAQIEETVQPLSVLTDPIATLSWHLSLNQHCLNFSCIIWL